jgi:hypothetical protein
MPSRSEEVLSKVRLAEIHAGVTRKTRSGLSERLAFYAAAFEVVGSSDRTASLKCFTVASFPTRQGCAMS